MAGLGSHIQFRQRLVLPVRWVPEEEQWRLGLLDSLLARRDKADSSDEESVRLCAMIASLVST